MANSIAWILSKLRFPVPVALGGTGNDGTISALASNVSWDTVTTPGQYFIPTATGVNNPLANVNYVLTVTNTANGLKQTAMLYGNPLTFSRAVVSGSWGPWYKTYDQTNIIGTVSQASGVPTGAIIETGVTGGARYTKWADGTMICEGQSGAADAVNLAAGSLFISSARSFTFLAPFITPPIVIPGTTGSTNALAWACITGNPTASAVAIQAVSFSNQSNTVITYIAKGRWF